MLDQRMIPSPTLARAEMDARLRALGYTRAGVVPRTHLSFRLQSWRHPTGSSVMLCEVHILGERYVAVSSEAPEELARTLDVVPRATMLREADAAPGPHEALPWLRRLCLLEYDVLSPELRAHLERLLTADDLIVRRAAVSAAEALTPEHALWAFDLVAKAETDPTLRSMYERVTEAERARLSGEPGPAAGREPAAKGRSGKRS